MPHKSIADECLKAVEELDSAISDNVPDAIYHYTKKEKFRKIIESRELRMTNATSVNDTMELRRSFDGNVLFEGYQFKNEEFEEFREEQRLLDVENYYLACFSKDGNSLSQFCAYGDYCIGFESQKLKKNLFQLFECVYTPEAIKEWIVEKDKLKEWKNKCFDNGDGEVYKRFVFYGVEFAVRAKFKSSNYESENEIRLLVQSDHLWQLNNYKGAPYMFSRQPAIYLENGNDKKRYVKFFIPKNPKTREELNKIVSESNSSIEAKEKIKKVEEEQGRELLPISKVVIGPMQCQEEAVEAAKKLLRENGYDKVDVISSDIPFRGN
jgi:hypothetical protein